MIGVTKDRKVRNFILNAFTPIRSDSSELLALLSSLRLTKASEVSNFSAEKWWR